MGPRRRKWAWAAGAAHIEDAVLASGTMQPFKRVSAHAQGDGDAATSASGREMSAAADRVVIAVALLALSWTTPCALAHTSDDGLSRGFLSPPNSAKPRVWWHWMNGNVTKEGIRLDLEWMNRIGIGGLDCIDASIATPQVVPHRLVYMSSEWKDAFRYAASLAARYGMELAIDSSPGWSETGGPWVTPAQAMKKLVWSTTDVRGGAHVKGFLPPPPKVTGPFQNIAYPSVTANSPLPEFYADTAVIAYRVSQPPTEFGRGSAAPPLTLPPVAEVSSSAGPIAPSLLTDGDLTKTISLAAGADGTAWIELRYAQPQTIRTAVLGTPAPAGIMSVTSPMLGTLQTQDTRGDWRDITTLTITNVPQVTASFSPVTARAFRLRLSQGYSRALPLAPAPGADTSLLTVIGWETPPPRAFAVSQLALLRSGRVNEFERKAGFAVAPDYEALATPPDAGDAPTATADVLDVTEKMSSDGAFDWIAPPGEWRVLRFGYSLIGKTNSPATPEATGLEVDKLNRSYVQAYMEQYLDSFSNFLPPALMGTHGLRAVMLDSTEVGPQNWTDDLLEQFQRLRGYDPRPWMPALTGVIVGDARQSDEFLSDFRRTLGELTADAHYATVAARTRAHGLIQYEEALELERPVLGDDMQMRSHADIPTGAMWMYPLEQSPLPSYIADDRGAASVAHLYGQSLAAAESLTSAFAPWAFSPRGLKPIIDLEFALGINRIIIHTSVHQPSDQAPGLSLAVFGQSFNRHETWAQQAGPWIAYLARSSYLLQQGRYAADVAYFYGEDAPLTILQTEGRLSDAPTSYGFDFVNADALLNLLDVRDGRLVTPSGMRYRVLQLGGGSQRMTVAVLRKLKDLVQRGAVVVGEAPVDSPSLVDDPAEFQRLKGELWGSDGRGGTLGLGRVYAGLPVEAALSTIGISPDLTYSRPHADTELAFLHRTLPEGEIYFLSNRKNRTETLEVSFRVADKAPELWHAQTGARESASFRSQGGRTMVPLRLNPYEAVFVIFRQAAATRSRELSPRVSRTLQVIAGPWTLHFQPGRGAAAAPIILNHLQSWSRNADPGIRYFSGTAIYSTSFDAPRRWFKSGQQLMLDLGDVREVAEVKINGQPLGVVWNAPYRVDITKALHPGANRVQVKVTNLWVNRLIGDQQPGARKIAFVTFIPYRADAPLRDSGLLTPVTIVGIEPIEGHP
jgi:hypothetical protein